MMRYTLDFGSPLPPGWTVLEDQSRYWDRFTDRFGFRPGIAESTWPAIAEPMPSITFDLTAPADVAGVRESRFDAVNAEALRCFVGEFAEDAEWRIPGGGALVPQIAKIIEWPAAAVLRDNRGHGCRYRGACPAG